MMKTDLLKRYLYTAYGMQDRKEQGCINSTYCLTGATSERSLFWPLLLLCGFRGSCRGLLHQPKFGVYPTSFPPAQARAVTLLPTIT